jgi:hypothetical protein
MTGMPSNVPDASGPENLDSGLQKEVVVLVKDITRVHLLFAAASWISIFAAYVVFYLFHYPDLYWMYAKYFWYDLLGLWLSALPLLVVVSINTVQVGRLLQTTSVDRRPMILDIVLPLGMALPLLVPIAWFMRNLLVSVVTMPGITALVSWTVFLAYMVYASAIITVSPAQFAKRCLQSPQFWFAFILVSLLITVSLIPFGYVLLGGEAWQYYTYEELFLRRLPAIVAFAFPVALLIPTLPLILEYCGSGKRIHWLWD